MTDVTCTINVSSYDRYRRYDVYRPAGHFASVRVYDGTDSSGVTVDETDFEILKMVFGGSL